MDNLSINYSMYIYIYVVSGVNRFVIVITYLFGSSSSFAYQCIKSHLKPPQDHHAKFSFAKLSHPVGIHGLICVRMREVLS